MKTVLVAVSALGLLAVALPATTTPAAADTVIIHRHHHDFCHKVRDVRYGRHGKTVVVRRVCH